MRPEPGGRAGDLRRRLARVLLGLTIAAASILGFGYWAMESYVERHSLSAQLAEEIDRRLAAQAPASPGEAGEMLRYFLEDAPTPLPAPLAGLDPGVYDEFEFQQRRYRVLVRKTGTGRAYLLNDVGPLATRENQLVLLLIVGVGLVAMLAWVASARLATIALAPLERLARAIRTLDPARRDARLALEEDQELRGIGIAFNEHLAALARMTGRELAFAASVSHELRTHLAVVENTAELLDLKAPAAAAETRRIARAARRAREDLEALLATTRPQPPASETVDLPALLKQIAADVASGVESMPPLDWDGAAAAVLRTDPRTLAIIFSNLLRNAVIAVGADGRIRITTDAGGFTVTDNGPGLPAGDWARLFEPWFEGRNGGSGLGLFVAHTLAQRLGGHLRLEAAVPHGLVARFEQVSLPDPARTRAAVGPYS